METDTWRTIPSFRHSFSNNGANKGRKSNEIHFPERGGFWKSCFVLRLFALIGPMEKSKHEKLLSNRFIFFATWCSRLENIETFCRIINFCSCVILWIFGYEKKNKPNMHKTTIFGNSILRLNDLANRMPDDLKILVTFPHLFMAQTVVNYVCSRAFGNGIWAQSKRCSNLRKLMQKTEKKNGNRIYCVNVNLRK